MDSIVNLAKKAKNAACELAVLPTTAKNKALLLMANDLMKSSSVILSENALELKKNKGLSASFVDRLALSKKRIKAMAESLRSIAALKDPVGDILDGWLRPNGLWIQKVRVPIGVVAIIYESRPNVTSDCIGLCLKSSNACILRGGSEAISTNKIIYQILSRSALSCGIPQGAISFIDSPDKKNLNLLLGLAGYVDLIIPRGGEGLIGFVQKHSKVPVIKHYKGICHVYVDKHADLNMAENICFNAKVQRPGVCNAMETMLVHKDVAYSFLPSMIKRYKESGVEIRGCRLTMRIAGGIKKAVESDWRTEYLGLVLSVKVVNDIGEAISHINSYGSHHSDAIVTAAYSRALDFLNKVDSACVYVNSSTRFTDGYEFGMGAEIGISTDKIHARGPMALEELTTYKYLVFGNGQVRK